jgi:serine/threonine-protein kinase
MTSRPETARRPRRVPGLLLQIAAALAAVGTIPLVLAAVQLASVNREALLEQLLRTHAVAARTAADQVDAYLAVRRALAATLAADPRLSEPASGEAQAVLADSLAGWTAAGVAGIAVHDAKGRLAVRVQTREAAADMEALLAPAPDPSATVEIRAGRVWVVVPVPLSEGRGTLAVAADAAPLTRALAPDELGDQARLVLLDRAGRSLLGGGDAAATLPPALVEAALSGRLSGAGRYHAERGADVVGAWSGADEGRWVILSTQPAAVAEAAAHRMARRTALAVGLALALTALISIAAWRGLVRPLRALLAAQRQVAGLRGAPAAGSETIALRDALDALERHARDRDGLDQVFLGRYQVLEILGSGGMGTVFRGWDPRLQRTVALKTIHVGKERDGEARARGSSRILAEAVRAAQITHPNVVAVYDAEEAGEVAYVAMEYVDGVGLDRYLEERGTLDWREAAPLARALAQGLAAAHARGLVHRDVKPGNVLLGRDGSVKLADFGLATWLHLRVDKPGKVFGTPGFLAPEVLRGEEYDARADLFALGVVLFRSMLGRYPFRGLDFRAIVRSTVRDPSPVAEELAATMPPELAEILTALLAKDSGSRPAPTDALATRLDRFCRDRGLTWRLDFSRPQGDLDARKLFAPVSLPSVQIELERGEP